MVGEGGISGSGKKGRTILVGVVVVGERDFGGTIGGTIGGTGIRGEGILSKEAG